MFNIYKREKFVSTQHKNGSHRYDNTFIKQAINLQSCAWIEVDNRLKIYIFVVSTLVVEEKSHYSSTQSLHFFISDFTFLTYLLMKGLLFVVFLPAPVPPAEVSDEVVDMASSSRRGVLSTVMTSFSQGSS